VPRTSLSSSTTRTSCRAPVLRLAAQAGFQDLVAHHVRARQGDHASVRGPWHLPGPDFHRLAIADLASGYVMTSPSKSWRPDYWTLVDPGLVTHTENGTPTTANPAHMHISVQSRTPGLHTYLRSLDIRFTDNR
jgi:hypothetical protein